MKTFGIILDAIWSIARQESVQSLVHLPHFYSTYGISWNTIGITQHVEIGIPVDYCDYGLVKGAELLEYTNVSCDWSI